MVVDNTNPDTDSRKAFIAAAKKLGVMCRCFVMAVTLQQAKHNNLFRELTDSSHAKVSDIVINTYKYSIQYFHPFKLITEFSI